MNARPGPMLVLALATGLAPGTRTRGPWGVAYAPADLSRTRPPIVFLHGMWAGPEDACPPFARAAAPFGFLVCPRGNAPVGDASDRRMWKGTHFDAERQIEAALRAVEVAAPGRLDRGGGTLVGYSNGAYFAAEIASSQRGRWRGLVVLAMRLDLDAARLSAAGVERVVLAAGERDGAYGSMRAAAERLVASGVAARFMSLGAGGHELPADLASQMCAALAWARDERLCSGVLRPAAPAAAASP